MHCGWCRGTVQATACAAMKLQTLMDLNSLLGSSTDLPSELASVCNPDLGFGQLHRLDVDQHRQAARGPEAKQSYGVSDYSSVQAFGDLKAAAVGTKEAVGRAAGVPTRYGSKCVCQAKEAAGHASRTLHHPQVQEGLELGLGLGLMLLAAHKTVRMAR